MDNTEYEISFADLFQFIRQGLVAAISLSLLLGLIVYFISSNLTPQYRAKTTIIAAQPINAEATFGVSLVTATPIDVSAYAAAATSIPVLSRALQLTSQNEPRLENIEALKKQTSVRTETGRSSSLITISVTDTSASEAAKFANAMGQSLVDWDKQRATENIEVIINTLNSQIAAIDTNIRSLQATENANKQEIDGLISLRGQLTNQLSNAQTLSNSAVGLLRTLEPAIPDPSPVAPNPIRNTALAIVLGMFLTYGFLLLRSALDTKLRSTDQVSALTNLPILGEFPRLAKGSRRTPIEAGSYLRTNLMFALGNEKNKTILVTSSIAGEGKSSMSMAIAESMARNGFSTLLVDADLRKPVAAQEYKLKEENYPNNSLEYLLKNPEQEAKPVRVMIDGKYSVDIIPSFQAAHSPTELLNHHFRDRLDQWRGNYDYIIIDSAPVLPVADTLIIAPIVTGTVLVTGMQTASRTNIQSTTNVLQRLGIRILGIAVTQVPNEAQGSGKYGYGYGYGYGQAPTSPQATKGNSTKLNRTT